MIQTLPLVLFVVMTELSIGSFLMLFLLDWRNEVKRSFLVLYALLYLLLTGLTYLFQQNFSTQPLLDSFSALDKAWTGYQSLTLLIFLVLLVPYALLMLLDKQAGVDGKHDQGAKTPLLRLLRLAVGILAAVAGLATLFVMGMIYRPLAPFNLGGAFTVASFFAGALALGGVMTAMWLGHWYLVTPALTERPLLFSTTIVLVGLIAQIAIALAIGPVSNFPHSNAPSVASGSSSVITSATPGTQVTPIVNGVKPGNAPIATPLSADAINWLRILVGFAIPLVLGGLAWKLIRDRSFQSATGLLYLAVVCILAGEAMARGLFLMHI